MSPVCVCEGVCARGKMGSKGRRGRVAQGNKETERAAKGEGGCTSQKRAVLHDCVQPRISEHFPNLFTRPAAFVFRQKVKLVVQQLHYLTHPSLIRSGDRTHAGLPPSEIISGERWVWVGGWVDGWGGGGVSQLWTVCGVAVGAGAGGGCRKSEM